MQALIFASNNKGKLKEIHPVLSKAYRILTLAEAGIREELPEPFFTFKENAWSKASYVSEKTGQSCFAEDSGLVVPALGGAPGVLSARYAGTPSDDAKNNRKLLAELEGLRDRRAWYTCTICLILQGETHYFEGRCEGRIAEGPAGSEGFGYDPLFIPAGHHRSFAEFGPAEKFEISHRGQAVRQLLDFLANTISGRAT